MSELDDWTHGQRRLLGQRCDEGHAWYLPRPRCPRCGSAASPFEPIGTGTIFAQTTIHRRGDGGASSIGITLVDLDEGIRVMAQCAPGTSIGSRVVVSIVQDADTAQLFPYCEVIPA
ncbi:MULTISPECIES: zinc ribbon domain-containing protein [unclassified Cryobacterium]|uniref:Zn-ribbon domain-containing OB-fold protein n=1 Tax=unclassified Cryobacterium TaxID=2649013 RepID=UPI000CE408A3